MCPRKVINSNSIIKSQHEYLKSIKQDLENTIWHLDNVQKELCHKITEKAIYNVQRAIDDINNILKVK
jgi:vacuolar-type H+-ATPase subunit E/Vma4